MRKKAIDVCPQCGDPLVKSSGEHNDVAVLRFDVLLITPEGLKAKCKKCGALINASPAFKKALVFVRKGAAEDVDTNGAGA